MSDIAPISRIASTGKTYDTQAVRPQSSEVKSVRGQDKVELSDRAQLLSKLNELPDVRSDLVERIKAEINAGTYETPDKIDAAIDKLGEDLF